MNDLSECTIEELELELFTKKFKRDKKYKVREDLVLTIEENATYPNRAIFTVGSNIKYRFIFDEKEVANIVDFLIYFQNLEDEK